MEWQTTYPTIATLMEASVETLSTWLERLPAPQTDVERTVRRRLQARHDDLLAAQVKQHAPEFAAKFNALLDRFEAAGIKTNERRF